MLSVNGTHGDHCPHIVKFPDISGFPRKVVTLRTRQVLITCSEDEFCYYLVTYTFICTAHIVCGVGLCNYWASVHPSGHCCGFAAVGPAARRYWSRHGRWSAAAMLQQMQGVPRCQLTLLAEHRLFVLAIFIFSVSASFPHISEIVFNIRCPLHTLCCDYWRLK